MKINVIGTTGSGKSTLGKELAALFQVSYVELDAIYWKKNWQSSSDDELNQKLTHALNNAKTGWILDGNYSRTIPIKWQTVDMVVWLDYSFLRTLYQSISRTITRILSQAELWSNTGNTETWRKAFFSRDSIIVWLFKTYHLNKKRNISYFIDPQYKHIQFVRLTSPAETRLFLQLMKQHKAHP
ncbi:adenylate kinase [Providencia heimbachae]|uniref:adenylate kinase n=1 Tax=Providencia heimbachae TaxID=333962 RepID=UPI0010BEA5D8|nr:adenylate kinase [Providencia heimbachae]QCJ70168.1 adenylate kinase [Providencia heimbachae]